MKLALPLAAAAFLLAAMPCLAMETITLPQPSTDGTPQATAAANQSGFTPQDKTDSGLLSQFHFSATTQSGLWDRPDSWSTSGSGTSSSAGYFDPKQPGSEFFNSSGVPH